MTGECIEVGCNIKGSIFVWFTLCETTLINPHVNNSRIVKTAHISTTFFIYLQCHTSSMFDPLSLSLLSESIRATLFFLLDILDEYFEKKK